MGHPYRDCFAQPYAKYLLTTNLLGRLQNGMGPLSIALYLRSQQLTYAYIGLSPCGARTGTGLRGAAPPDEHAAHP